jgi:hypothetical protein
VGVLCEMGKENYMMFRERKLLKACLMEIIARLYHKSYFVFKLSFIC